jgi:hypothetical protein
VSLIVGCRVDVDFDDPDAGVGRVLGDPFGIDEDAR